MKKQHQELSLHCHVGREYPRRGQRAGHDRHGPLVHPVGPADLAQLATQEDRWLAGEYDGVVGYLYDVSLPSKERIPTDRSLGGIPFGIYMILQV